MNPRIFILLLFFSLTSTTILEGNNIQAPSSLTTTTSSIQQQSVNQYHTSGNMSFPCPTGFFLLRQEEVIFIAVDTKKGGLNVHYRKHGVTKIKRSCLSLSSVAKRFNEFPFIKISRSTIINFYEIEEYEGTRRNARLVMSNGQKVNVSRRMAAKLHDYIKELEV